MSDSDPRIVIDNRLTARSLSELLDRRGTERGILRRVVPQWLALPEMRDYVVGFEEAHAAHGGGGALYVRLRRSRRFTVEGER